MYIYTCQEATEHDDLEAFKNCRHAPNASPRCLLAARDDSNYFLDT